MKKTSIVLVLLLVLLTAVACDEEIAGLKYSSAFDYPEGWVISKEETTGDGIYVKLDSPSGSSAIIVSVLMGYEDGVERVKEGLMSSVEPAQIVVEKQRTLNGIETIYFEVVTLINEPLRLGTYIWVNGDDTYVLTYMAQEEKYPDDLDDLKVVLDSMTKR